MKRVSKAILIVLAAVIALVVGAVFSVNLFIQSPGAQARIQEGISRALRLPLKIMNSSVTPWGDLRITGITIPNGDADLLEAASFHARYRVLPLFTGKLVIYDMSVESPKIVWPQNAEGKWELPQAGRVAGVAAAEPPGTPAGSVATPATPAPAAGVPARVAEEESPETKPAKKRGLEVIVEGFEIKRGDVELLDAARQPVAAFSDVNMVYTTLTAERIEGTATIGRIEWARMLTFENVRAPFNYTNETVDLPQITGGLGGGTFTASFNLKSTAPKTPFSFGMKFDKVDLARLAKEGNWREGQSTGTLDGLLDLHGNFPRFSRAEGTAHLTLHNGRFHEFSYFEMIGQALQIRQLSDLRLKDSTADARIADEKIHFDSLTLDATDLQIQAKGYSRFEDRKLSLAARLIARNSLIKQLPGIVRDNFATGENDTRYIDFNITGKADKPKTDLLDKIVGKKLETQFDELLSGIFGKKRKDDDKAKDDARKAEKKKKKKDEMPAEDANKPPDARAPDASAGAARETQ